MSFGNEVRDFLAAYTQVRESGLQQKRFQLEEKRFEADEAYRAAQIDLERQNLDLRRQQLTRGGGGGGTPRERSWADRKNELQYYEMLREQQQRQAEDRFNAVIPPSAAAPVETFNYGTRGEFGIGPIDETTDEPVEDYSRGGLVKSYQQGGVVEDPRRAPMRPAIPTMDSAPAPQAPPARPAPGPAAMTSAPSMGAAPLASIAPRRIPERPAVPGSSAAPPPVQGPSALPPEQGPAMATRPPGGAPETSPRPPQRPTDETIAAAAEATDAALRTAAVPAAIGPGAPDQGGVDFATNRGALPLAEYEQVVRAVDPNGELSPHLQSMAVLVEGYNFFRQQGNPERAAQFSAQILTTQRQITQTLGALAGQALENGDVQSACRLLADACNRFPSEHAVSIVPGQGGAVTYEVRSGEEVVERGRLNSAQLWELTGAVTNGTAFLEQAQQFGMQVQNQKTAPRRAVQAAIDARLEFVSAEEALTNLEASEDATEQELQQARERVRESQQAVREARQAAIDAGNSRVDVDAEIRSALDTRIDDSRLSPPPEQPDGPGLLGRAKNWLFGEEGDEESPAAPAPALAPQPAPTVAPGRSAPRPTTPNGQDQPIPIGNAPPPADQRIDGARYVTQNGRIVIWRAAQQGWEPVQ